MKTLRGYIGIVIAFVLTGCGEKIQSGGPMTREQALAESELKLPLASSAQDVYFYLIDRGSQDHDLFLRYKADASDIKSEIAKEWEFRSSFAKSRGRDITLPITDKTNYQQHKTWSVRTTPSWWKPQDIRRGFFSGTEGFEPKSFWVDEDTNTVYFHQIF